MKPDGKLPSALGFLTVLERQPHGLFGGYLLLNLAGRPLEFHCTAPLRPNRAQQILYGPTLTPFLYGEHIGRALAQKAQTRPLAILTNQADVLALRTHVEVPVGLVQRVEAEAPEGDRRWRIDAAHASPPGMLTARVAGAALRYDSRWRDDGPLFESRLAELPAEFDLLEPFARIEEAIDEAQRAGR